MTSRLLRVRDVAELLDVSSETVLRRIRAGQLPAIRIATNALRIREDELDDWLEQHREKACAE